MTNSLTMSVCFILDVVFMLLVLFQHSSVSGDGTTTENVSKGISSSVSCVKNDYVTPDINVICNCSVGWPNVKHPDIPLIVEWMVIKNGTNTTVTHCHYTKHVQNQTSGNGSQPTEESNDTCDHNPMILALTTLKVKDKGLSGQNITCTYEIWSKRIVQVGDFTPHLAYGPDDVKLTSPNNKYRPDNDDTMTLVCKAKGMPKPTFTWEGHPESSTIMRHCVMDTPDNDVYDSTLTFSHADLAEGHLINCTVTVAAGDWTNSIAQTFMLKDSPNPLLSTVNIVLYVVIAVAFLLLSAVLCQYVRKRRDRGTEDAEEAPPPNPPPNHSLERSLPRDIRGALRPDDAGGEQHTSKSRSDVSQQPRSRSGAFRPDNAGGEPHTSRSRSGVSEEERSRSEVREHHSLPTPTPVSEHSLRRDREGGLEGSINQETHTSPGLGVFPADQSPPQPAIFAGEDEEPIGKLRGPGDPSPSPSIGVHGQPGLDNMQPQARPDDAFQTADDLDRDHDDLSPLLQDP